MSIESLIGPNKNKLAVRSVKFERDLCNDQKVREGVEYLEKNVGALNQCPRKRVFKDGGKNFSIFKKYTPLPRVLSDNS